METFILVYAMVVSATLGTTTVAPKVDAVVHEFIKTQSMPITDPAWMVARKKWNAEHPYSQLPV